MKEERALLTPLQSAFNDGVEAAKTIIREHSTEGYCEFDYWRASLINAIARKTNPHAYRADIADERVKQAWKQALAVALDYQRMGINEFKEKYGTAIMSNALEVAAARAAEGGEGE